MTTIPKLTTSERYGRRAGVGFASPPPSDLVARYAMVLDAAPSWRWHLPTRCCALVSVTCAGRCGARGALIAAWVTIWSTAGTSPLRGQHGEGCREAGDLATSLLRWPAPALSRGR